MANRLRGEVAFEANGKSWTLHFSTNAYCELEDQLGMGLPALAKALTDPAGIRLKTLRALIWAGLRDRQPDVSLVEVGQIMDDAGIEAVAGHVMKAFEAAMPEKKGGGAAASGPMRAERAAG